MRPPMRLPTIVLATGTVVLLIAVAVGEHMGNRVIGQATEQTLQSVIPQAVTPAPDASPRPYGPDWKRSQALSTSGDPRFPDPRIPPQPLPTLPPSTPRPRPKLTPTPPPTPTPNPNIPIWRQKPLPTINPYATGSPGGTPPPAPPGPADRGTPPPPRCCVFPMSSLGSAVMIVTWKAREP